MQIVESSDPTLLRNTLREQRREEVKEGHSKPSAVEVACVWVHSSGRGALTAAGMRASLARNLRRHSSLLLRRHAHGQRHPRLLPPRGGGGAGRGAAAAGQPRAQQPPHRRLRAGRRGAHPPRERHLQKHCRRRGGRRRCAGRARQPAAPPQARRRVGAQGGRRDVRRQRDPREREGGGASLGQRQPGPQGELDLGRPHGRPAGVRVWEGPLRRQRDPLPPLVEHRGQAQRLPADRAQQDPLVQVRRRLLPRRRRRALREESSPTNEE